MSLISKNKTAKEIIENKDFRHSYVWEHIKRIIPFQIRTMRTEREWSQAKAGEILGKPQNVISRLESPAYGKLSIQTLMEIARGFDVGLIIKFVPFSRFLNEHEDVSFEALCAQSPTESLETQAIWNWASVENETSKRKLKTRNKRAANPEQKSLLFNKSAVLVRGNGYSSRSSFDELAVSYPSDEHSQDSWQSLVSPSEHRQNIKQAA